MRETVFERGIGDPPYRAVAIYSQTQAPSSVIVLFFVAYSHHKHPKYRGREFNPEHCLRYYL